MQATALPIKLVVIAIAARQSSVVFKFQVSPLICGLLLTRPRSGLHKPTTSNQELLLTTNPH